MVLKEWLEPDAGRPARPVLRGRRRSDAPLLPDKDSITVAYALGSGEVELLGKIGTTQTDIDRLCKRLQSKALVQIASSAETLLINMDTLSIEKDSIPDGGRCGVLEPESAEVELPFANAMHQLDS
jgi:hypothetical protein